MAANATKTPNGDECNGSLNGRPMTAAIVIIGDEILKGHTVDSNSAFLLASLWHLGIKVKRQCVIPDDVDVIAEQVRSFASDHDHVFCTGGIGPTHDDVTFAGISKAFDVPLVLNESMLKVLRDAIRPKEENQAFLKMAMMPASCQLDEGIKSDQSTTFPLITIRNVFILPGVPKYMRQSFEVFKSKSYSNGAVFHQCKLYIAANETDIAHILEVLDQKYKGKIHIGSYPAIANEKYRVKVTLESENGDVVKDALKSFSGEMKSQEAIVEIIHCLSSNAERDLLPVERYLDEHLSPGNHSSLSCALKGTWAVLTNALDQYRLSQVCLSFNGGKDCTVLLHLWLAAVKMKLGYLPPHLQLLYVRNDDSFPEAEEFITRCVKDFRLNVVSVDAPIKDGMSVVRRERPAIRACLMGTRRHDPYSSTLRAFTPTDPGWPSFMRINPILEWSYQDVWLCLKSFGIPYCSLYDQGYTSLGSKANTKRNPSLLTGDGTYLPACALQKDCDERLGRH